MDRIRKTLEEFAKYEEIEIVVDEKDITEKIWEMAHEFGFNVELKNETTLSFTKCKQDESL